MSRGLKTFLSWIVFQMGTIGTASVFKPEWYTTGAYREATSLMPIRAWGCLMILIAVAALFARLTNSRHRRSTIIFLFVGYTLVQLMFAYSIFALTWKGGAGAFAGSIQWAGYSFFAYRNLYTGVRA